MSPYPAWRLLPVTGPGIPNLLVSSTFSDDSYTVHFTDLANVWAERMQRKPIIQRGLVEDTSIDPSDGPDQLRRMLELLRAAFESDNPEHHNTTLSIAREEDGGSLAIHVTCILPEPLKPLRWPMQLTKCPQSDVATKLVLPMIQANEARMRDIDQLVVSLKEKDGVITRLVDKLEATGSGLDHVFSSLSGKRKVTRAAAEAKVKGLALFSETEFRNKAPELRPVTQTADVSSLLEGVFGAGGLRYESALDLEASNSLNDWWIKLGKGKHVTLSQRSTSQPAKSRSPPALVEAKVDGDDDDFEVLAAPPYARKRNTHIRREDEAIDDDDDDETSDGENAQPASPSPRKAKKYGSERPQASGSRLGALGGSKAPSRSPVPQKTPPKRAAGEMTDNGAESETASEAESDKQKSPPPRSPAKHLQKRSALGRIGGKSRQETPPLESAQSQPRSPLPSLEQEDNKDASSQLPRRHKLGLIGKKVASPDPSAKAEGASDDGRGRPQTAAKQDSTRETSLERADRKRSELQRDLERRAAAGPAKKKRKF